MNRDEAIKAIRNGAIAACISAGFTLVFVLYAVFSNSSGTLQIFNDPTNFFDILLVFGCAFGVYKKSRFAAILLFVYFIVCKIIIGIELGKVTGIGIGLIFLYFYGKAIQGTFSFHKIEKTENPNFKKTSKWAYIAGIPAVIIFFTLLGFGLMTVIGFVPSTEVQSGDKMLKKDKEILISNEIINSDDNVLFFYSGGFTSILEGGNILTDNRVIRYIIDENQELQIYEIHFDDIASVEQIENGDFLNDAIYMVNSQQPDTWLRLSLSTENQGDALFIKALKSKLQNNNL